MGDPNPGLSDSSVSLPLPACQLAPDVKSGGGISSALEQGGAFTSTEPCDLPKVPPGRFKAGPSSVNMCVSRVGLNNMKSLIFNHSDQQKRRFPMIQPTHFSSPLCVPGWLSSRLGGGGGGTERRKQCLTLQLGCFAGQTFLSGPPLTMRSTPSELGQLPPQGFEEPQILRLSKSLSRLVLWTLCELPFLRWVSWSHIGSMAPLGQTGWSSGYH